METQAPLVSLRVGEIGAVLGMTMDSANTHGYWAWVKAGQAQAAAPNVHPTRVWGGLGWLCKFTLQVPGEEMT